LPILLAVLLALALAVPAHAAPPATAADRDCSDFPNQAAAQDHFVSLGGPGSDPDRLDADKDGIACETLPCPCRKGSGGLLPPQHTAETIRAARIVAVVDGDTIKVLTKARRRLTVRLIGIDTPETSKPGRAPECGGRAATTQLRKLSFKRRVGRRVTLVTDQTQDRTDQYGRLLAYARVDSGKWLQLEQLRAGWATIYVFGGTPFERLAAFQPVEAAAKALGRGVWGRCAGDFHRRAA
jgi:endonuclease YncB( thermonuclease family)